MFSKADCSKAYQNICHLSMRYVGAFYEACTGKPVGLIPQNHPGNKETRDLINLILICRAEINALAKLCYDKGVFTNEEHINQLTDDLQYLTKEKAQFLGVEVTDYGLVFTNSPETKN